MSDPESTAVLLNQARLGSLTARDRLIARYLPLLRAWASGRMPARARGVLDTDDLVQVTLIKALDRIDTFEPKREGAFLSYLRSILMNSLRDHLRRSSVRTAAGPPNENLPDPNASVMEEVLGRETLSRYEAGLLQLTEEQREAVILRVEFGYSHQEVADAIGSPSANAARMTVSRGLLRLAEIMNDARP